MPSSVWPKPRAPPTTRGASSGSRRGSAVRCSSSQAAIESPTSPGRLRAWFGEVAQHARTLLHQRGGLVDHQRCHRRDEAGEQQQPGQEHHDGAQAPAHPAVVQPLHGRLDGEGHEQGDHQRDDEVVQPHQHALDDRDQQQAAPDPERERHGQAPVGAASAEQGVVAAWVRSRAGAYGQRRDSGRGQSGTGDTPIPSGRSRPSSIPEVVPCPHPPRPRPSRSAGWSSATAT